MGVKIRERSMAGGYVAFYIDTYHKDFGRFSQKTGLQANPKNRKVFSQIKAEALEMMRKVEKDLQRDPSGVFSRKAMAGDDFVEYARKRAEKEHYASYMNALKRLVEFTGGSVSFKSLNSQWLERFKGYLLTVDGLGSNSASTYFIFVKGVIRLAFKEGYVSDDFVGKVDGIKKQPVERHVLTLDELDALSRTKCTNQMVKGAFMFASFTGLRLSDIELMKWEKIIIENGQYFMKFKQKKTGQFEKMPLCAQAVEILQSVQKLHAEYAPDGDERVFILPGRPQLGVILNEWGFRSGLAWRLHFHSSRHTFASMALSAGTAFFTVSNLLGHRDLQTTEIYSHSFQKDQIEAVQGFSMLSPVIEPQAVTMLPSVIVSKPEQIVKLKPAMKPQPGSVTEALRAKGEKVAAALSLKQNAAGKYVFNGKEFTAVELALEV
jgi:integrase